METNFHRILMQRNISYVFCWKTLNILLWHFKYSKNKVSWLNWFNDELKLRNGLLLTVLESPLSVVQSNPYFDPPLRDNGFCILVDQWLVCDVNRMTVAQIKEEYIPS